MLMVARNAARNSRGPLTCLVDIFVKKGNGIIGDGSSGTPAKQLSFFRKRRPIQSRSVFVATCSQGSLRARQADTIARLPEMKVHRLFPTNLTPARRKPGMSTLKNWVALWLVACACVALGQNTQEARLMRFPDIYKDKVVFMYGGDLWLASTSGGAARRITTNPGRELFPKFSPDGKWIAFTGQYDGNFNVYVMPAEGGQPKQLTFYQGSAHPLNDRMGIHDEVVTWTPDSKRIVFLSRRDATNGWIKRPFTVSIDGGLPEPLPVKEGGLTSFSPDGTKIAYNQIFRNFRTWKRYTGGLAQSITIYDLKNNTSEDVPHTEWTDTFPMWHGNAIYFSSDRGPEHHFNLYSYDLGSKQIEQLTHFNDFDVMWPSLGPDAIVFENAGYLYAFDFQSKQPKKLALSVPGERDQSMKHWTSVSKNITDFDISPDGKRAVFSARGDVFTVPAKEGSIRNLTRTPGIREKLVAWSPDSKWLAYDKPAESLYSFVNLYSLADRKITPVTTTMYNSFAPTFDPDGKYLYFLSDRDFNEVLGNVDFEFANPKTTRVYIVTLKRDEPSPFKPQSDEAGKKEEKKDEASTSTEESKSKEEGKESKEKSKQAGKDSKEKEKPPEFRIDLDGIQDRIVALPGEPAVIRSFSAAKGFIYFATAPAQGLSGPIPGEASAVHAYDLKERKNKVLIEEVERFALSFDGTKLLYESGPPGGGAGAEGAAAHSYGIIDAKPDEKPKKVGDGALALANMRAEVDPPDEWKQMFNEVWRQERDYFFEPSMNGADWEKLREKYSQLLPYVSDRYSLTYILGEMIGELSNSHTYVDRKSVV